MPRMLSEWQVSDDVHLRIIESQSQSQNITLNEYLRMRSGSGDAVQPRMPLKFWLLLLPSLLPRSQKIPPPLATYGHRTLKHEMLN